MRGKRIVYLNKQRKLVSKEYEILDDTLHQPIIVTLEEDAFILYGGISQGSGTAFATHWLEQTPLEAFFWSGGTFGKDRFFDMIQDGDFRSSGSTIYVL